MTRQRNDDSAVMTTISSPRQRPKLEGVNGIRGTAALFVVLFHVHAIAGIELPGAGWDILRHFYLSVLLFFVLSAFTLSYSASVAPVAYGAYLVKRFFRIAPLFYLLVLWNLNRIGMPDVLALLANLTFTFNLFPGLEQSLVWAGWSVGAEMTFYIIFPALLLLFGGGGGGAIMGFLAAVSLSHFLWMAFDGNTDLPPYFAYYFVGSNLASFTAGILAYRYCVEQRQRPMPRAEWPLPAAFVLTLVIAYLDPAHLHHAAPGLYFSVWALAFAMLCAWQAISPSRLFRWPPLQWLGDRSYSVYLLHPVVIELGRPFYSSIERKYDLHGASLYVACAAATLPVLFAIAELAYRMIESPAIRLGSRLANRVEMRARSRRRLQEDGAVAK